MKKILSKLILPLLVSGASFSFAATTIQEDLSLQQEEIKAFEAMFDTELSEIDVYKTDRLLRTATKRQISLREAPAIATVITADEIKNMGARNIMDVLKMVPGIGISRNEQGFFMLDIRGTSSVKSEKVLVMIDGHSQNRNVAGTGFTYLHDNMSVDSIRQIEVIRGPGSALYGANAFVGVINIITKQANDIEGIQMSITGGSFEARQLNILGGKTFDNGLQLLASLDYQKTNGPNLNIQQDRVTAMGISNTPGDANTEYEALELLLKVSYMDFNYEGHFIDNSRDAYIGFAYALTSSNIIKYLNFWQEASYSHTFSDVFSSNIKFYWDEFDQDASLELFPSGFAGSFPNGFIGGPLAKNRTLGSEVQFDYDITKDNHLLLGFMYEKMKQFDVKSISNYNPSNNAYLGSIQDISAWGNWNKNVSREVYAAYLQDEWKVLDNLNLTGGVRYDHYTEFGGTINPRAGVVWSFLNNAEMKLLYGQAFRAPTFTELHNDNNPSLMGSSDLQPEKIKSYEAAIGYRFQNSLRVDFNYFYNDIDDLITKDSSTSPPTYANLGGAEIDGIEFVLSGQYRADNYWKLSYSYQDPKDADTGARIANLPNQRASLSANYAVNDYIVSHVDVLWTGERPRSAGDNRTEMPSYTTVDLTMTGRNFYKNMEIIAAVHNLLDEDYRDPDLSGSLQYIPFDYPRAGISGSITAVLKF